jgi:CHAT domain-containing protein
LNKFFWLYTGICVLFLFVLVFLEDTRPAKAQTAYNYALRAYEEGNLLKSQREAELGIREFQVSNPDWAVKFQLLDAETMVRRGMYLDALQILSHHQFDPLSLNEKIRKLSIEAEVLSRQGKFSISNQKLSEAELSCSNTTYSSCGRVLRARGILAVMQGDTSAANLFFQRSLLFARIHKDRFLEASASVSLGWVALQIDHFDEAITWSRFAYGFSLEIGANGLAQAALGNLGWAYYQLGDNERALNQFLEAKNSAERLGNLRDELKWITTAGYIYRDSGDSSRAIESYQKALNIARKINSEEDISNALEDLAQVSVETEKLTEASVYLDQIHSTENQRGVRLNANIMLTRGMLAALRHQDQQAQNYFRAIQNDLNFPTMTRLNAGDQLGHLFERQGNLHEAELNFKATLAVFESARAQLKHEDSQLPFAANASGIYDDYIQLLVEQGRIEEALAAADRSRARTLAQGLGIDGSNSARLAALRPGQIAQRTGATLLFYWLGAQHSYLWAITPTKITLLPLPGQKEIAVHVERYRRALLDGEDTQRSGNEDGQSLYQTLVAPAAKLIRPKAPVMILADGALSQLNFETLLAPGPSLHYWIEDQTLLSAPSLELLASYRPAQEGGRKLLLIGNPVTPSPDYPSLPLFGAEMNQISRHFGARGQAVFAGPQATPAAYLGSHPAQYSYIHFVSHATASRIDPLDSAIILSGDESGENAFKLYARDIMQHPIDARLVTISACNGSGTRTYAGEGLVGLSWAFLRAGAHHVIGALWEVSDKSTPQLMDALYQGLQDGQTPSAALRNAKLDLLRARTRFSAPFYWAPFQLYTRQ